MSRMNEVSQQQDDRENLSGLDDFEAWVYQQEALPEHKRDGYSERMAEMADRARKEQKENF
jgi:hypothetical protein